MTIQSKRILVKLTIFLSMILCLVPCIGANEAKPVITVSHEIISLNQIKASESLEFTFTIQNTGNKDLLIHSMTSDCPCTTLQYSTEEESHQQDLPKVIAPGEKAEVKLLFDSNKTKYIGAFKKLVFIRSNDPDKPIFVIKMIGEIVK